MQEMIKILAQARRDLTIAGQWVEILEKVSAAALNGDFSVKTQDGLFEENRKKLENIPGLRVDPLPDYSNEDRSVKIDFFDVIFDRKRINS